jgi:FAD:protein FMN transferase
MKYGKIPCMILTMTILCISFFTSCAQQKVEPVEKQEFLMGTIISERVYGKNAQVAADEAMKLIADIEKRMTINAPGGEINGLNEQAGKGTVKVSSDTMFVMETAKKFGELSEGTFDVTIGPLVREWGIFTDHPKVPEAKVIGDLRKLTNYRDLKIVRNSLTAGLARQGQILDLGGIAKGYTGDAVIDLYKKHGIKSGYINLGGNVVTLGSKPDGTPWRIGVQNPRAANGRYIGIVSIKDKAVVSSGDYERFFDRDGKRYHHILDPRTGYPSDSDLMGTTIVMDSSTEADALSTSTFVLGLDKGMKLVESLKGVEAIFITKDKKVYATKGLKDIFKFEDETGEYEYIEKR